MWELARPTSRGGLSARRILTYALATIVAAFLWVLITSPAAHAADANWEGASIRYEGNQYFEVGKAKEGESHGIPVDSTYYSFVKTVSERPLKQEAFVLYFSPGLDPPNATKATYVVYDYTNKTFSNARDKKDVTIDPTTTARPATTCAIEGIGWAVCQLSTFLAGGMDFIFQQIAGFMEVQPATVDNNGSSLYIAWNIVRGIANVAFIIAFLIIIYSQIANAGISNYGIKKLLPRLIVAAILVNLSYFICAIAIDLSNVIAFSIQDIMMGLRDTLFNNGTNPGANEAVSSWESITGFILSGGTAALAGGIGIGTALLATGGDPIGLVFILLPALLALILAVLVVLVILAARQAIITILLIISPLAFVAFLLPNTEKWFEKWRDLFFTMLIFFPAFALVFGGSQVAGTVIIMNANSINVMLLGMIVQVAPLIITPLLLKLSGGLLGRIAGIVNDPRKGLVDRTRNWANAHAESRKFNKSGSDIKRWDLAGRAARNLEYRKHRLARKTELGKQLFDNYAVNRQQTDRFDQRREVKLATEKMRAHEYEERFNVAMEEQRAGKTDILDRIRDDKGATSYNKFINAAERRLAPNRQARLAGIATNEVVHLDTESRHLAGAKVSAQLKQQERYATLIKNESLSATPDLALRAKISGIDDNGFQRALANSVAALSKIREETIGNMQKIIGDMNATNDEIRQLAQGTSVRGIAVTQDSRAAALKMLLGGKDTAQIAEAMKQIDFSFAGLTPVNQEELRVIAAEALEANASRPPEVGAGVIANMKQGLDYSGAAFTGAYGQAGVDGMIISAINREKIDSGKLQTAGKDYADTILAAIQRNPGAISGVARARLLQELATTLDPNREASEKLGDSKKVLEEIQRRL